MQSTQQTAPVTRSDQSATISTIADHPEALAANSKQFCGICGYQNAKQANICLNCGEALGTICSNCSQLVPANSKFCGQCGTRLPDKMASVTIGGPADYVYPKTPARMPTAQGEKIAAATLKSLGERREVTVLFLDITNFTAVSHDLDNEDVYDFINEAMSVFVEVIRKYGGTIDKFTGDGLMAIFGAPVVHEDDPERAVQAALEIHTALRPLQQHTKQAHNFDLSVRIGINTGWVIAGKLGNNFHKEYTVIGDTVNLASRLEGAAKPGTVLVSTETYRRTRNRFSFDTLPPLNVKGLAEPVNAYRPIEFLEKPVTKFDLPTLQVPMVGRDQEIAQLQNAMDTVRHTHHSKIAVITGQAGVGKSRLVAEFRRTLVESDIRAYQGNCSAINANRPLSVIAEFLRNILEISETTSDDNQRTVLLDYLNRYNLSTDDTLPYLLHVLGLKQTDTYIKARLGQLDAVMLQRQTHTALRKILMAEARLSPRVFIFEDLHWIDPASKDFLEYFVQSIDDISILIILVARQPEGQTTLHSFSGTAPQNPEKWVELRLKALSEAERNFLVGQLLQVTGTNALNLKRHIAARAEGNPFYIEEIIRMLIDQGGLVFSETTNTWTITPLGTGLLNEIPSTIQGLILARFDSLPESVRQTLQKAAVFGITFPIDLLQRLNGFNSKMLEAHLNELEVRHFISQKPFRSEAGYTFRHALTQEVVYNTLLKRDRSRLHAEVAEAIEKSQTWTADEKIEALAYHYVNGVEPVKALPYLISAGENAARRCAYQTAVNHYQKAVHLSPDNLGPQFFRLRLGLGEALKFTGELAAAREVLLETLQQLWGASLAEDETILWAILVESLQQLADVRQREGSYDEALTYLEAGMQVLGEAGAQEQPDLWYALLDRMAWIRFRQGQLDEASALVHSATANVDIERTVDSIKLASLYNTLGGIYWQQGNLNEAVVYVERSLKLYRNARYSWGRAVAYGNLGVLYDTLGSWPKAVEYYDQAYALQENIGDKQNQAVNLINLGMVHMRMGKHAQAQKTFEAGLSLAQSIGDNWGEALCNTCLAELNLIQSNVEGARLYVEQALTISDEIGSSEIQVQARRLLALILAKDDQELTASLKLAEQALNISKKAKLLAEEANCHRVYGVLFTQTGQYAEAEDHLNNSVTLAQEQNDPYSQGLALLELGRLYHVWAQAEKLTLTDWKAKANTALTEAVEKFNALGATFDLKVAQTVFSQIRA